MRPKFGTSFKEAGGVVLNKGNGITCSLIGEINIFARHDAVSNVDCGFG